MYTRSYIYVFLMFVDHIEGLKTGCRHTTLWKSFSLQSNLSVPCLPPSELHRGDVLRRRAGTLRAVSSWDLSGWRGTDVLRDLSRTWRKGGSQGGGSSKHVWVRRWDRSLLIHAFHFGLLENGRFWWGLWPNKKPNPSRETETCVAVTSLARDKKRALRP